MKEMGVLLVWFEPMQLECVKDSLVVRHKVVGLVPIKGRQYKLSASGSRVNSRLSYARRFVDRHFRLHLWPSRTLARLFFRESNYSYSYFLSLAKGWVSRSMFG